MMPEMMTLLPSASQNGIGVEDLGGVGEEVAARGCSGSVSPRVGVVPLADHERPPQRVGASRG